MDNDTNSIWNEFSSKLLNFINYKINNAHDGEDILQDVFLKLYKNIDKLEELNSLNSWLFTITKNTIIDYYRKKKDYTEQINLLEKDISEINEITNFNSEISQCMSHMIEELPPMYKESINMYEHQGFKHKEIAEKIDISLSTSKIRLKRAKEKLKLLLNDCCHFETDTFGNILDYQSKNQQKNIC